MAALLQRAPQSFRTVQTEGWEKLDTASVPVLSCCSWAFAYTELKETTLPWDLYGRRCVFTLSPGYIIKHFAMYLYTVLSCSMLHLSNADFTLLWKWRLGRVHIEHTYSLEHDFCWKCEHPLRQLKIMEANKMSSMPQYQSLNAHV